MNTLTKKHIDLLQEIDDYVSNNRRMLVAIARQEEEENDADTVLALEELKNNLSESVEVIEDVLNGK